MVKQKITEIILDILDLEENQLNFSSNIKDDLEIDSLDLFQIIDEIEGEFDITIEGLEEMKTLDELVNKVEALV